MACIPSSPVVLVSRGRSNNVMLRQPCLISGDVKCRCSHATGPQRPLTAARLPGPLLMHEIGVVA